MKKQSNAAHAELQDTLARLEAIRPDAVSIETLQRMQATVRDNYSELVTRGLEHEASAQQALETADPEVLQRIKRQAARLRAEMESLEELDGKLENAIQPRIVRDNMIAKLGSRGALITLETIIMILIVLVLGLLGYDSLAGPDSERPEWLSGTNIFFVDAACCAVFMAEFFFRLSCAESKKFVWAHHWVDFVTSIPIPGEAQLARFGRLARLARFARFARIIKFFRFLRLFFLLWRGMDKLQDVIDVKLMKRTLRWAIVVTLLGALLVYQIEGTASAPAPASDATISADDPSPAPAKDTNAVSSYPLALWWSFTTVVTGGFGDIYNPESAGGQVLTAILIITGMVLVGVFTATLTSLFVGEQSEELEKLQEELSNRIDELSERLERREYPPPTDEA